MPQRVLVLTDENLAVANEVPESIRPLIGEAEEIYVIAPTLTTWVQSLTGDIDAARLSADERLQTVFEHMHASGLEPRGTVGDEDQVAAIGDALAGVDADLIVLRLHAPAARTRTGVSTGWPSGYARSSAFQRWCSSSTAKGRSWGARKPKGCTPR